MHECILSSSRDYITIEAFILSSVLLNIFQSYPLIAVSCAQRVSLFQHEFETVMFCLNVDV